MLHGNIMALNICEFLFMIATRRLLKVLNHASRTLPRLPYTNSEEAVKVYLIRFIADLPLRLVYGLRD